VKAGSDRILGRHGRRGQCELKPFTSADFTDRNADDPPDTGKLATWQKVALGVVTAVAVAVVAAPVAVAVGEGCLATAPVCAAEIAETVTGGASGGSLTIGGAAVGGPLKAVKRAPMARLRQVAMARGVLSVRNREASPRRWRPSHGAGPRSASVSRSSHSSRMAVLLCFAHRSL
jgi:hypothetical protein